MAVGAETQPIKYEDEAHYGWVDRPIQGDATDKNLLTIHQLNEEDVYDYLDEAKAAEEIINDKSQRGIALARFAVLIALMKQPSTRTGGSMVTAMQKLGGTGQLINDFSNTSEAKGETAEDGWLAFAAQADVLGIRTKEEEGSWQAAETIAHAYLHRKIERFVPVINLGNGTQEHPTQALGDLYTISKHFPDFRGRTAGVVGDHLNYRAFHSFMLAAAKVGMKVVAIESEAAPVPDHLVRELGSQLERTDDLDAVLGDADVLYMGRRPAEYVGKDLEAKERSQQLERDYDAWRMDANRLQLMPPDAMLLHPRPRGPELDPSVDYDPRAFDVTQMGNMIPARMGIIARHLGTPISKGVNPPGQVIPIFSR